MTPASFLRHQVIFQSEPFKQQVTVGDLTQKGVAGHLTRLWKSITTGQNLFSHDWKAIAIAKIADTIDQLARETLTPKTEALVTNPKERRWLKTVIRDELKFLNSITKSLSLTPLDTTVARQATLENALQYLDKYETKENASTAGKTTEVPPKAVEEKKISPLGIKIITMINNMDKGEADDNEIVTLANQAIESQDSQDNLLGLVTFNILVHKQKAYDEAFAACKEVIARGDAPLVVNALDVIEALYEQNKYETGAQTYNELMMLCSKYPDANVKARTCELASSLVKSGQGLEVAYQVVQEGLKEQNKLVYVKAVTLLSELVQNGRAFQEALVEANKNADESEGVIRFLQLNLFALLVEQGQYYQEAFVEAKKNLESERDQWTGLASSNIFVNLIERDQYLNEIDEVISKKLKTSESISRNQAVRVLAQLAQKGVGIDLALEEALLGVDENDQTHAFHNAVILLQALIHYKRGYDEALTVAEKGIVSDFPQIREASWSIIEFLSSKGLLEKLKSGTLKKLGDGKKRLSQAIEQLRDQVDTVRIEGIRAFVKIVEDGYGYHEALQAAYLGSLSLSDELRIAALRLLKVIVEKGKFYQNATSIAVHFLKDEKDAQINLKVREEALALMVALVKKRQATEEALSLVKASLENPEPSTQEAVLVLLKSLVERGLGIEVAKTALEKISNEKPIVKELRELVIKMSE